MKKPSVSLKPLLFGEAKDWPQRMIFSHWNRKVSVRTQGYRLDNDGALFDMAADPGQVLCSLTVAVFFGQTIAGDGRWIGAAGAIHTSDLKPRRSDA